LPRAIAPDDEQPVKKHFLPAANVAMSAEIAAGNFSL
jgi:hypothetical protein